MNTETNNAVKSGEENDALEMNIPMDVFEAISNALDTLDDLDPMMSVKATYKDFKNPGEKCRGIFVGFETKTNGKGDSLNSIVWTESDRKSYYNSGVILVGDCRNFNNKAGIQRGTAIEITFTGMKNIAGGRSAKNYEIMVLNRVKPQI